MVVGMVEMVAAVGWVAWTDELAAVTAPVYYQYGSALVLKAEESTSLFASGTVQDSSGGPSEEQQKESSPASSSSSSFSSSSSSSASSSSSSCLLYTSDAADE